MTVVIITDSAAALPRSLVDAHHIEVVPMRLTLDECRSARENASSASCSVTLG